MERVPLDDPRHLNAQVDTLHQRIQVLEQQIAKFGKLYAPAHVLTELEDAQQQLTQIRVQLQQQAARVTSGETPYKGLLTFQEQDAGIFFGRETLVATLIERVRRHAFLAVLGPSGSGKSSAVRAGLIPALKSGQVLEGSE